MKGVHVELGVLPIADVLNEKPGLNEFCRFKKWVTGQKTFSVEFSDVLISI